MSLPVVAPPSASSAPAPPVRTRTSGPFRGGSPLVWFVALLVVATTLGPVLYAVLGGFRTNAQLAESPAGLPNPWVLENYQRVLTSSSFWRYALNSTVVALVTTVVAVVFGLMAAYPLARYQFRWREPLYMVFVLGLLFPATVAIIPLFIIITRQLHLGNTWWGVALPQAAFALPVTIRSLPSPGPRSPAYSPGHLANRKRAAIGPLWTSATFAWPSSAATIIMSATEPIRRSIAFPTICFGWVPAFESIRRR